MTEPRDDPQAKLIDAMTDADLDKALGTEDRTRRAREYVPERTPATRTLVAGKLADIQPETVRWLWPGRLPLGKLAMLDGDPGLGKSLVTLDLAARVTTGTPMPGETTSGPPASVIILSAEDGLADTIRPRLDALGADVAKVYAVVGVEVEAGGEQSVTFPLDLDLLRDMATGLGATLIVIDPFVAFIGDTVNTRIDHDVRRLLAPLARLAESTGAAVVAVRHLNKSSAGNAVYRGGGSIAFIGAARAGLLVARDPDDASRRVLATTKMNLAPEPPSLGFEIANRGVAPCIRWLGETEHRANDLVIGPEDEDGRRESQDLKAFIHEMVEAAPRTQKEAVAAIRAAGFDTSDRTIRRARKAAGVEIGRNGFGPGSVVVWSLGNGHSGHIPDIGDTKKDVTPMATMGQYDDPDQAARAEMRDGA